ncbi:hypothetical protein AB0E66_26780 [Streptomyces sp. NPDC033753]|uniref:hypothetical protein n=1 Tax=Streptomyces sp. NPDC033753 TaxID=3155128 RepID=UPI0033D0C975
MIAPEAAARPGLSAEEATAGPWAAVRPADVCRGNPWAQHRLGSRIGTSFDIATEAGTDRIAHDLTIWLSDRNRP